MEYINVRVSMPLLLYIELEEQANKKKITRNEVIIDAILGSLNNNSKLFRRNENCRNQDNI